MNISMNSLGEDELELVSGGMRTDLAAAGGQGALEGSTDGDTCICPECGKRTTYIVLSGGRRKCNGCGRTYELTLSAVKNNKAYEA